MNTKKILIADDDEAIIDATVMLLEVMGYDVDYTLDGTRVPIAVQKKPNLIILDIWMSGTDGRDICKALKKDPQTKHIPVLMISASADIRNSALESGANDFLEKPFDLDILIGKIESLL